MSYGYGGGPNWPMIRAKQRAESEANDARRHNAQLQASASEWRAKFEALAKFVRKAADRTGEEHQQEDGCSCRSCWDAVITKIVEEPQARDTTTGHVGNPAGTFSFADLFGGSTPPGRN
jgi:predicted adenine nucleotide alpha hydrolase (AANH) superfamily ATPase